MFAAGALIVLRPMIPALHPLKTGAACLMAALTLGLAAGSLGLGPGDTAARRLLRRRLPRAPRRARGRDALLGVRQALLDRRLAHPVRLPAARRRPAAHGRVDREHRHRHAHGGGHHHRARAPHHRDRADPVPAAAAALASRAARRRSRSCGRPTWRSRCMETGRLRGLRAGARAGARSPNLELELDEVERAGARGRAHPDGQPALAGHGVRRHRVPDAEAVLPQALRRRPEARHEGHRAGGGAARGGAQPLQRRGAPGRDRQAGRT